MSEIPEDDTLLAHLAWRLSSRLEDVAVEALGFILKSSSMRKVLSDVVSEGGADIGAIGYVRTQVGGEEGTRPDLVGFDKEGGECLMMEAKLWAGLTPRQPNAYLERLPLHKVLLFIVPTSRVETLWPELYQLSGAIKQNTTPDGMEYKSAEVGLAETELKHLMLISWSYLLGRMDNSGYSDMKTEIRQLRGFINKIDDEAGFPPLSTEELAPVIPRRLNSLQLLVKRSSDVSVNIGVANIEGLQKSLRDEGYGRYLRIAGAGAWFGIDTNRWAKGKYPDTPIWICFEKWSSQFSVSLDQVREALQPLLSSEPPGFFDEGNKILVPIPLPVSVEYESVIDTVVERIRKVADQIRSVTKATD